MQRTCSFKLRLDSPQHVTRARGLYERALAIDHRSVRALVGIAELDLQRGGFLLTDEPTACFSAAETNAIKALSLPPDDALAHLVLGSLYILTNRAAQGIAECEHALRLDRNLASAHGAIGAAQLLLGQPAETERHILEVVSSLPARHNCPPLVV
jgi:tetratricopeptide (TPR) repeat protein